jgi:hypothetical protein
MIKRTDEPEMTGTVAGVFECVWCGEVNEITHGESQDDHLSCYLCGHMTAVP